MDVPYELKLEQFSGPLEKLLELIEEKKLDITEISLAKVTADFIDYVKGLGDVDRGILADFLVVAAKLLLVKSKALLPEVALTEEEKEDIKDLEAKLRLYKEFKEGAKMLGGLWHNRESAYGRPLFLNRPPVFFPPPGLGASQLVGALEKLARDLKEALPETQAIKRAVITLEEKIAELANRITQGIRENFKDITKERSREEVIVLFLALLHLVKERILHIDQAGYFSDIIITKPAA